MVPLTGFDDTKILLKTGNVEDWVDGVAVLPTSRMGMAKLTSLGGHYTVANDVTFQMWRPLKREDVSGEELMMEEVRGKALVSWRDVNELAHTRAQWETSKKRVLGWIQQIPDRNGAQWGWEKWWDWEEVDIRGQWDDEPVAVIQFVLDAMERERSWAMTADQRQANRELRELTRGHR